MNTDRIETSTYLAAIARWRNIIIVNFLIVCFLAAGITLLMPKWYQASTTIMPPKQDIGMLGLSGMINSLPIGGLEFLRGSEEAMTYIAILESRTVADAVVKKFDLERIYESDDRESAIETLRSNAEIQINKEGTITVAVLDKLPDRSAAMANAFIHYLDSVHVELAVQKARNNRIFIEERFDQNKEDLYKAEESLKEFQQEHGAISLPAQMEAAITSAADLLGKITATEIELRMKEKSLAPTHEEVIRTRELLSELRAKLAEMKFGADTGKNGVDGKLDFEAIYIPFSEVPQVGLEYARRFREVEVQKVLYEILIQQYEQAKLQEAKDIPTVQVLDPAMAPIKKAKPRRMRIVLLSGFSATLILIFLALIFERLKILQKDNPALYNSLSAIFRFSRKQSSHG